MKKRIPAIILFCFLLFFFFSLVSPFALAEDRKLEVDYPEIFGIKPETVKTLLPEYAKYIFNFSIAIFGLVVFGVLVKGGALYMTAAGNPSKMTDAKEQISSAFLGLIILLSSYLILTTINPQLVIFDFPLLKKPETCKTQDECLRGFECKEGRCVKLTSCNADTECPVEHVCKENVCVMEEEEMTLISREIPLGQMIENGIWKEEEIEKAKKLLDEFESFLATDKISDLNKYLKGLTDTCQCGALIARCTKPEDWGTAVDCTGDPCEDVRDEIDKMLEINDDRMEQLKEYKNKITEQLKFFNAQGETFLNAHAKMQECLERGDLLTLNEYLEEVKFYEEQGWKTVIIPFPGVPSKGDSLTFYCSVGGTIFDGPRMSSIDIGDITKESFPIEMPEEEMGEIGQLSCPAVIPVGEMLDDVAFEALQNNQNLELVVSYIDEMMEEIRNMDNFVSKCNAQNCEANCACIHNPCYQGICGCIPTCPGDPPFPNPCWPGRAMCFSPCLQTTGACVGNNPDAPYYGSPCPRTSTCANDSACPADYECKEGKCMKDGLVLASIEETLDEIKLYEGEIFNLLKETKTSFSNKPYVLETAEGSADLLNATRAAASFCFNKDTEEPTWMMLNCEMALGNYGPDGNIIADCHPNSFFCCTADKKAADKAKKTLPKETQEVTYYYQPQVALSGDCNSQIIAQAEKYAEKGIPYSQPKGHCFMRIPFGPDNVKFLDCSGLVSRVYHDLGIFPNPPSKTWCLGTATIPVAQRLLYEIKDSSQVQKGDLVLSGWPANRGPHTKENAGHVVIYAGEGNVDTTFKILQSGGGGSTCGGKVCYGWRKHQYKQKYYRRKNDCGATH